MTASRTSSSAHVSAALVECKSTLSPLKQKLQTVLDTYKKLGHTADTTRKKAIEVLQKSIQESKEDQTIILDVLCSLAYVRANGEFGWKGSEGSSFVKGLKKFLFENVPATSVLSESGDSKREVKQQPSTRSDSKGEVKSQPFRFTALPVDKQISIINYLDLKSLGRMQQVSKECRDVKAEDKYWQRAFAVDFPFEDRAAMFRLIEASGHPPLELKTDTWQESYAAVHEARRHVLTWHPQESLIVDAIARLPGVTDFRNFLNSKSCEQQTQKEFFDWLRKCIHEKVVKDVAIKVRGQWILQQLECRLDNIFVPKVTDMGHDLSYYLGFKNQAFYFCMARFAPLSVIIASFKSSCNGDRFYFVEYILKYAGICGRLDIIRLFTSFFRENSDVINEARDALGYVMAMQQSDMVRDLRELLKLDRLLAAYPVWCSIFCRPVIFSQVLPKDLYGLALNELIMHQDVWSLHELVKQGAQLTQDKDNGDNRKLTILIKNSPEIRDDLYTTRRRQHYPFMFRYLVAQQVEEINLNHDDALKLINTKLDSYEDQGDPRRRNPVKSEFIYLCKRELKEGGLPRPGLGRR